MPPWMSLAEKQRRSVQKTEPPLYFLDWKQLDPYATQYSHPGSFRKSIYLWWSHTPCTPCLPVHYRHASHVLPLCTHLTNRVCSNHTILTASLSWLLRLIAPFCFSYSLVVLITFTITVEAKLSLRSFPTGVPGLQALSFLLLRCLALLLLLLFWHLRVNFPSQYLLTKSDIIPNRK